MRQVVSLFLPTWPTDRLRRRLGSNAPPPETPLVLAATEGQRRLLTAANIAARAIGLAPGMTVTQAQALVPELQIREAEPDADRAALEKLAHWSLRRYAPIIACDPPDGLMLDITGAAHPFGGPEGVIRDLIKRLAGVGTAARAVCAPTYGAAHALARYGTDPAHVVDPLDLDAAISTLPIAALRLDAAMVLTLGRLGLETIADLEAMPRASLALRFGSAPGKRLDQAFGRIAEPFEPVQPPESITVERRFAEPIGAPETIARYTGKLVDELVRSLEDEGVGARQLDLSFHRVDNRVEAIRAGLAKPSRDRKQMTRLLCDRLETIDPGFGIERMQLRVLLAEPLTFHMISNLGEAPVPDVAALVDLLGNRLGEGQLFRVTARESDIPERSVARIAPMSDPTEIRWPANWPRPTRLFARPEPVDTMALLPDHPPAYFVWRSVRRRVTRADGPERVYGEWHLSDAEFLGVRDYFQVEDETGARYWLFRNGDGLDSATGGQGWFLHGLFA